MANPEKTSGTLLYDPDCGICQRTAGLLGRLALGARIAPGDFATLEEHGVDYARFTRQIPFVTATGHITYGVPAFALALGTSAYLPMRWVGRLLTSGPIRPLADAIYQHVADKRPTTCRLDSKK